MNISLRKANAVQNSINEAIRGVDITTTISINEFQDIEAELTRANNELFANDVRRQKLLLALYNIRGLVGTANAQSGIDMNLAKAAFIDKRVAQLEEIASAKPVTDLDVLKGKMEKIRNRVDDSRGIYGRDDSLTTSVVGQEQLKQIRDEIKNLKKQKQKLNDEILELNIKTEIPLSDDVVTTLQSEGLI
jgi:DNA repair exonuclease SbcCD ATPase subunit